VLRIRQHRLKARLSGGALTGLCLPGCRALPRARPSVYTPLPLPSPQFTALAGQAHCRECPVGKYSNVDAIQLAEDEYRYTGTDRCVPCAAGRFAPVVGAIGRNGCLRCTVGQYQTRTDGTRCKSCAVGRFADTEGTVVCEPCLAGRFNDALRRAQCQACPAGKFSDAGVVTSVSKLPTANCQLPTANCQLPTASCQLPTASCQLPQRANSQPQ
jgi:hypothetical protein